MFSPLRLPECQLVDEEGDDLKALNINCAKNPGHPNFFSVSEFKKGLPLKLQEENFMNYIQAVCDRTVKIYTRFTSYSRPDTFWNSTVPYPYGNMKGSKRARRVGTGFFNLYDSGLSPERMDALCPCPLCAKSDKPKAAYWTIDVETATHVIYDNSEACQAVVTCFYDPEEFKEQPDMCLYGATCRSEPRSDSCSLECVTHNEDLVKTIIDKIRPSVTFLKLPQASRISLPLGCTAILVSHPHGLSKKVSFGDIEEFVVDIDPRIKPGVPLEFTEFTCCFVPAPLESEDASSTSENTSSWTDHLQQPSLKLADIKTFLHLFDLNCPVLAGHSYILPAGTKCNIPSASGYLYTIKYSMSLNKNYTKMATAFNMAMEMATESESAKLQKEGARIQSFGLWKSFPPETKFTLPSGEEVNLPPEVCFYSKCRIDSIVSDQSQGCFTYDACTCPGSSGAVIITEMKRFLSHYETHAGSISAVKNRSGPMRTYDFLFDFCRLMEKTQTCTQEQGAKHS